MHRFRVEKRHKFGELTQEYSINEVNCMMSQKRYSLHCARITGALLLFAPIGWVAFFFLGAFFGTWDDPNAEDHAAVA